MLKNFIIISILSISMSSCDGRPKTTEADSTSVVFVNDTENQKVDVKLNGTLFTSYHYQGT